MIASTDEFYFCKKHPLHGESYYPGAFWLQGSNFGWLKRESRRRSCMDLGLCPKADQQTWPKRLYYHIILWSIHLFFAAGCCFSGGREHFLVDNREYLIDV